MADNTNNDNLKPWETDFKAAAEKGFKVELTNEFRSLRDKHLQLESAIEKYKKLGDESEIERLISVGREAENKNKTAEQKLAEYEAQVKAANEEKQKLVDQSNSFQKERDDFYNAEIEKELAGFTPEQKQDILADINDLPKQKQITIIRRLKPGLNINQPAPPDVPAPGQRKNKSTAVTDMEVDRAFTVYRKDGATREQIRYCLERNIKILPYVKTKLEQEIKLS